MATMQDLVDRAEVDLGKLWGWDRALNMLRRVQFLTGDDKVLFVDSFDSENGAPVEMIVICAETIVRATLDPDATVGGSTVDAVAWSRNGLRRVRIPADPNGGFNLDNTWSGDYADLWRPDCRVILEYDGIQITLPLRASLPDAPRKVFLDVVTGLVSDLRGSK